MFSVNTSRGHPNPNATLNAFMAVGVAANWSSPMVINTAPLFLGGVLNGWEDPYFYFDLDLKKWRVLYHEITDKQNACTTCGKPMPGIHKHCGGYAESEGVDIWGRWTVSPPQIGAYTLDIDFAGLNNSDAEAPPDQPPRVPPTSRSANLPFKLGRSYAAYANATLTSWGGNAVAGDDGLFHLFTSAMSDGRNNNAKLVIACTPAAADSVPTL